MGNINQVKYFVAASVAILISGAASTAHAQTDAVDNELKRINGHWRLIEMTENGR